VPGLVLAQHPGEDLVQALGRVGGHDHPVAQVDPQRAVIGGVPAPVGAEEHLDLLAGALHVDHVGKAGLHLDVVPDHARTAALATFAQRGRGFILVFRQGVLPLSVGKAAPLPGAATHAVWIRAFVSRRCCNR